MVHVPGKPSLAKVEEVLRNRAERISRRAELTIKSRRRPMLATATDTERAAALVNDAQKAKTPQERFRLLEKARLKVRRASTPRFRSQLLASDMGDFMIAQRQIEELLEEF